MKELSSIYKKTFFGKRYKLVWRAEHLCNAVMTTTRLKEDDYIVDVGCATGEFVNEFRNRKINAIGFEGSSEAFDFIPEEVKPFIYKKDLRKKIPKGIRFKVALCLEVAEHIEAEYSDRFVENLTILSDYVIMSAAPPGQKGHYHVNCKSSEYWDMKFQQFYFKRQYGDEVIWKNCLEQFKRKKGLNAYYANTLIYKKVIK